MEKGHGRLEIREYWTISDTPILEYLDPEKKWKGLGGIGMVKAERCSEQKVSQETRYASGSILPGVKTFAYAARGHWGIEKNVLWVLHGAFREDDLRVRLSHADENLAVVRHISLNLVRQEQSSRVGIHVNRRIGRLGQRLSPMHSQMGSRRCDCPGEDPCFVDTFLGVCYKL